MSLFKRPKKAPLPERRLRQPSVEVETVSAFQRGRTLTGSASPLVVTASEAKADLKSSRVQAHELRKKRRRLITILVIACVGAAGLYGLVSQFTAQPVVRASPDPSLQLEPVYAEAINAYLADHMSERIRPLTNTTQLTRYLQASAPEVQSVKVRGSAGFGKSVFELTFRQPIASWDVSNRQLYVDAKGIPFSRNYFSAPTLHIIDQSGTGLTTAGQSIMSNRFMSYIGQVIGLSESRNYRVRSIVIPEGMTRQIEVHIEGISYPVKFSSDRPAGEGVEDMARVLQWMKDRQLTPEYVDVRVSGRAFYR